MKMIGRATNPEVLRASTQASFRNTGASDAVLRGSEWGTVVGVRLTRSVVRFYDRSQMLPAAP